MKLHSAVVTAADYGRLNVINVLVRDPRFDPSEQDCFLFRWAARHGSLELVQTLIQDPRVNPAIKNNDAVLSAIRNGRIEVVRFLLKDPRVELVPDENLLVYVARCGFADMVELLLELSKEDEFEVV